MCKDYVVAEELKSIAEEVVLNCECYMCARCVTCATHVPTLSYGAGMSDSIVERVNTFVIEEAGSRERNTEN